MNRLNTAEQARVVCSTVARHTHTQPEPGTEPGTDRHTHTRPKSQSQGQHHTTTTPHSSPLSIISPRASQSIPEHPRASQSIPKPLPHQLRCKYDDVIQPGNSGKHQKILGDPGGSLDTPHVASFSQKKNQINWKKKTKPSDDPMVNEFILNRANR